ncbi:MAG: dicarboxylate/amino acid:cation symporter [Spirochaetaceae bacterium]|nr:dicarboxylate/amino acid:cation symporter [Spirochaetaceae bacterium]
MDTIEKKSKLGLVPRLIIAIIVGVLLGSFAPEVINRTVITASTLFGSLLRFIIPLMILAFVTIGIADLAKGAGKLLGIIVCICYASTLAAGTIAYITASTIFPSFIHSDLVSAIGHPEEGMLSPFFSIGFIPVFDVIAALTLAFIFGACISILRGRNVIGSVLHDAFSEFSAVISMVLRSVIIPFLPLYICGTFVNMTVSGQTFIILGILWKVFLTVIILHLSYLLALYLIGGTISGRNPLTLMKNQIPGYLSAIGTQSSAATIPINLQCAEKNGISKEIRNFMIPLCANIHMPGSMITITCCVTAVLMMYGMPHNFLLMIQLIMMLSIAITASPGAPGGSIMSALPFLVIVGIAPDSAIASLLIALYITQDSFGTACNVSSDNAVSPVLDMYYKKNIKKS